MFGPVLLASSRDKDDDNGYLEFMVLAFAVALSALLMVELCQYYDIFKMKSNKQQHENNNSNSNNNRWNQHNLLTFLDLFIDDRDRSRPLTVTHIYLLIGCAAPCVLASLIRTFPAADAAAAAAAAAAAGTVSASVSVPAMQLLRHLGWLSVGVGDSAAAIVGTACGRHKWTRAGSGGGGGGGRSIEGSLACLLSMVAAGVSVMLATSRMGAQIMWETEVS